MPFFSLNLPPIRATMKSYQRYLRNAPQGSTLLTTPTAADALSPTFFCVGDGTAWPCHAPALQPGATCSLSQWLTFRPRRGPPKSTCLRRKTVSHRPQQAPSRWALSLAHSDEADSCVVSGPWKDHGKELRWLLARSW